MSGVALLFLHAYRSTRAEHYLDFAMTALRADLNKCVTAQGNALMVLEGHRHVPAFEHGSAGIALIAHEFLRWREDDLLRADLDGLLRACAVPFTREPGLFRGRAGLIVALAGTGQATAAAHAARFAWHAMPFHGHLAFPGSHLRRLSMDLATGSAGVLLALLAASEKGHVLPFTDTRYPVANGSTFILEGGDSHGIGPGLPGARPGAAARQLL
jgi:Lanthionine synthetase C-like protein